MRAVAIFSLAIAVAVFASALRAEEVKSGPQVGESLDAFDVVKVAGAPDDGVEEGKELCYRCKLGNRPVVMVFARESNESLAKLIKQIDQVVAKNKEDKKMGSFVNLLGSDKEQLKAQAKKLAKQSNAENVAVVVPTDHEKGPSSYKIDPKADVTVLIYKGGVVAANHAFADAKLSDEDMQKIISDTSKILQ